MGSNCFYYQALSVREIKMLYRYLFEYRALIVKNYPYLLVLIWPGDANSFAVCELSQYHSFMRIPKKICSSC